MKARRKRLAAREQGARARQQEAVEELSRAGLAGADPEELLDRAATLVARALGVEYAQVLELLPGGEGLALRAGVGWRDGCVGRAAVPAGLDSDAGYALVTGGPVIVEDLATETRFRAPPLLSEHGVVSGASVVISGDGGPYGVLGAHTAARRAFGAEDARFLQTAANVLAVAIDRARKEERARASLALLERTDAARRRLLKHLMHAEEEERHRIAAGVHDDSVQTMAAVGMQLEAFAQGLADREQRRAVEELRRAVARTLERLRELLFELRPPALDEEGLAGALGAQLERMGEESRLDWRFDCRLPEEPASERRLVLYRVAVEALTNVCKHARATRVEVLIERKADGVRLRVRDDGAGFSVREREDMTPGHLGLATMRERAELAGGSWRIESAPGAGTAVEAWIPWGAPAEEPGPGRPAAPGAGVRRGARRRGASHPGRGR